MTEQVKPTEYTDQQLKIRQAADDFLATLNENIPRNVVHHAVENARWAMNTLKANLDTVRTFDYNK